MIVNKLGMFAKYWLPGKVKTRLARTIGAEHASQLYRQFVLTLLERLNGTADKRVLAYSPTDRRSEFAEIAPSAWSLSPQASGDLGERMRAFFETHLVQSSDQVVLIGSDSPTMPTETIELAFEALRDAPVVLGPTPDGGYYLVGAKGAVPPIFRGIDWSTPAVWQQTLDRLAASGCRHAELAPWYDVDDLSDLRAMEVDLSNLETIDPAWSRFLNEVRSALAAVS